MEGPSLFLAAEQLAPFVGKRILKVSGNTTIGKERLEDQKILSIFSWGKRLFLQFDTFALRVHFLLFGSFDATVSGKKVTGDYPKKAREPRLSLRLKNGEVNFYSCSVRFVEEKNVKALCDFSIDTMSEEWDPKKALQALQHYPESEIADLLLDQDIFAGVGNIIKNEVLLLAKTSPVTKVEELSTYKLKKIVALTRDYVFKFYAWRKQFVLKKHYQIYRQGHCKVCGSKVVRRHTGVSHRYSYICPRCQSK